MRPVSNWYVGKARLFLQKDTSNMLVACVIFSCLGHLRSGIDSKKGPASFVFSMTEAATQQLVNQRFAVDLYEVLVQSGRHTGRALHEK